VKKVGALSFTSATVTTTVVVETGAADIGLPIASYMLAWKENYKSLFRNQYII
jgi:hypothetical protein